MRIERWILGCAAAMAFASAASSQVIPDRADPTLVTRSLPPVVDAPVQSDDHPISPITAPSPVRGTTLAEGVAASTIEVRGNDSLPETAFAAVTRRYEGRPLSPTDLRSLAGAVAGVARDAGLVFATASVQPQSLSDGVLVVSLDEGRVDAVRSIGARSAAADRILTTLVTHHAMTKRRLERTLLLVGDLPGVRIKDTRYMRENGFGILLVTLESTRVASYLEFDNRGTREIGPIRGVGLVNVRDVLNPNDELGLVAALTPIQPREFTFVSGRYALPVSDAGGVASISAFYGRTRAGGEFTDLALVGNSYGFGIGYSAALERSRRRSLWLDIDLHALATDQSAQGYLFREDRLTVLSGTLRGTSNTAGGVLHWSVQANGGLPVPGATRDGDPLASRPDGDARYLTGVFQADWTRTITGPVSIAVASVAQVASRPLLATAELSLGGPAFGRAYDYSERTGDEGILGSAELRLDVARLMAHARQRLQVYAFGDGGTVHNLRGGYGGGSLASAGAGIRAGQGPIDAAIEVAIPVTDDRSDTGNRAARVSFQISAHF